MGAPDRHAKQIGKPLDGAAARTAAPSPGASPGRTVFPQYTTVPRPCPVIIRSRPRQAEIDKLRTIKAIIEDKHNEVPGAFEEILAAVNARLAELGWVQPAEDRHAQ
jgi:hypothetical protein